MGGQRLAAAVVALSVFAAACGDDGTAAAPESATTSTARALRNAGPELTNETFGAGLEAIGEIDLPGFPSARIEPGHMDAAEGLVLVQFDAELGAWTEVP